tara:strand:- start:1500 stop:1943 length:444 start_codon:yes stop_codon:yes gene_type:complete
MPIKTFRGKMKSGTQDTIVLHTNDGSTGYRIVKFQAFPTDPGTSNYETLFSVYKVPQATVSVDTPAVDFADHTLLATAYLEGASSNTNTDTLHVVFDNEVFNQDIYITMTDTGGASIFSNYYIELEQIKLDLNENTVATLKDIRNVA